MLKYVFLIFLFACIGGCTANKSITQRPESEKQHPDLINYDSKRSMGIDFVASGNEPLWTVDMDSEDSTKISLLSNNYSADYKTPVPVFDSLSGIIIYSFAPDVILTLKKEKCSGNMSGGISGLFASLKIFNETYNGCGKYIIASVNPFLSPTTLRLNDIWALKKIGDKPVNPSDFKEGIPVLELHLNEGVFLGNTNCNTIFGIIDVGDSFITFSDITLTNKLCDGDFESMYVKDLKSVDSWSIDKMQLFLMKNGNEVLVFNKID